MSTEGALKGAKILVVDDDHTILHVVSGLLGGRGAVVQTAASGTEAVAMIQPGEFDLIVLDVMMPDLDGFQTAAAIRAAERPLRAVVPTPILMLTAMTGRDTIINALDGGADDFLSKPFNPGELLARAGVLIRGRRREQRIQELLEGREKMARAIVHDLRSPVTSILMNASLVSSDAPPLLKESLDDILVSGRMVSRMLDDLLLAARSERAHLVPVLEEVSLRALLEAAMKRVKSAVDVNYAALSFEVDWGVGTGDSTVSLDSKLFGRVLDNLLTNAVRYASSHGDRVVVRPSVDDDMIRISVVDNGSGVPEELRERIFEPFAQGSSTRGAAGYGLGLPFCRSAVEAHGGRIWVEEAPEGGAAFRIEIPRSMTP